MCSTPAQDFARDGEHDCWLPNAVEHPMQAALVVVVGMLVVWWLLIALHWNQP
jgi:hypothetical protein